MGLSKLPVLDPFNDICPLIDVVLPNETLSLASLFPQDLESYRTKMTDESDEQESELEGDEEEGDTRTDDASDHNASNMFEEDTTYTDDDDNDDRNAFDMFE